MANLDLRSNLKAILRERGMSQLELAQANNISPTNLNTRLARGRNCQLSLLEDICQTLKVDLQQLMYGDNAEDQMPTANHEEEEMYRIKYEEKCEEVIALQKTIIDTVALKAGLAKKKAPPLGKTKSG